MKVKKCLFSIIISFISISLSACKKNNVDVLIYTSLEDYRLAMVEEELKSQFPNKKIVLQYTDTGTIMSRLMFEGKYSDCDIFIGIEMNNCEKILKLGKNIFEDLSDYNTDKYLDEVLEYKKEHCRYHIIEQHFI